MNFLLKRLREPSTGAGVALLAVLARSVPSLAQYAEVFDALAAIGAGHAVVMPEAKKAQ